MLPTPASGKALSREFLDVLIRAGLIAVLAIFCFQIFWPFFDLLAWLLILAVTLYPLQVWLTRRYIKRDGYAATLIELRLVSRVASRIVSTTSGNDSFRNRTVVMEHGDAPRLSAGRRTHTSLPALPHVYRSSPWHAYRS